MLCELKISRAVRRGGFRRGLDQVSISATADNWGEASTPAVPENN